MQACYLNRGIIKKKKKGHFQFSEIKRSHVPLNFLIASSNEIIFIAYILFLTEQMQVLQRALKHIGCENMKLNLLEGSGNDKERKSTVA